MKHIILAAAALCLTANMAVAQTSAGSPTAAPGTSMGAPPTASPAPGVPNTNSKPAASGDTNQAVVTTGANADQPAKGANSFTMGQARHRIAKKGYSHVKGLAKDGDGVWRGTATKDGQPIQVWLDYKGNVGQQS